VEGGKEKEVTNNERQTEKGNIALREKNKRKK